MLREAVLGAGVVALAACATPTDAAKDATSAAAPLPANYRQLFAQYVAAYARTKSAWVVRDASISKPFDMWLGVLHGSSTERAVCVRVLAESRIFHTVSPSTFILSVRDGQVLDSQGSHDSPGLAPFPEVMQLIQR